MKQLTAGSLFAGIGGFDLGFRRVGIDTVWQVEIDPFCRAVLEKHFPESKRHTDVREVGMHNLEAVDIICGGFPCQDISIAGKGKGITGSRSGLWREYARIIGELRPRYVVIENSPALTYRGLSVILGNLAELGYDAEWENIPASTLGAPHHRERIWIVAYPNGSNMQRVFPINGYSENEWRHQGIGRKNGHRPYVGATAFAGAPIHGKESVPSRLASVDDGFPRWLLPRAAKAFGNAVYTVIPEIIGSNIIQIENQQITTMRQAA